MTFSKFPLALAITGMMLLPVAHAPATGNDANFASQIARLKAAHDPVSVLLASAAIGGFEPSASALAWRAPALDVNDPVPLVTALLELESSGSATTDGQLHASLPPIVTKTITDTYGSVPLPAQRAVAPVVLTIAHASVLVNQALAQVSPQEQSAFGLYALHHEKGRVAQERVMGLDLARFGVPDSSRERLLEAWASFTPSPLTNAQLASISARVDLEKMVVASVLVTRAGLDAAAPIRAAVAAGAWPSSQVADPLGLLLLGTASNDFITGKHWIIIDPAGNDTYRFTNAGGTGPNLVPFVTGGPQNTPRIPVSLALDLAGNDTYDYCYYDDFSDGECQGYGNLGVGMLIDLGASHDSYYGGSAQGGAGLGVGLLYDDGGDDTYWSDGGTGYALGPGLGVAYDRNGNDTYWSGAGDGFSDGDWVGPLGGSVGVLKDDQGRDSYPLGFTPSPLAFNLSQGASWSAAGKGILLDEGGEPDAYGEPYAHDNGTWQVGNDGGTGYGSDS
ncbi:MAG: hypothetical protein ACYDCK_07020 [Thermoplasmatota archaeon]